LTLSNEEKITKDSAVGMAWLALVSAMLNRAARFFILSLKRDGGGHSVGFVRKWAVFGRTTTIYFFDPNFGEVQVSDRDGLVAVLCAIDDGTLYRNRYDRHILFPFG